MSGPAAPTSRQVDSTQSRITDLSKCLPLNTASSNIVTEVSIAETLKQIVATDPVKVGYVENDETQVAVMNVTEVFQGRSRVQGRGSLTALTGTHAIMGKALSGAFLIHRDYV